MKKILIIRFSSIGDIVLTTPVVRCLKKQIPGVEIHFLTKHQYVSLLAGNPYIDKIIPLNEHLKEVLPVLKIEKYDYIIDLHKNLRTLLVKLYLFNTPNKSFQKLNIQKWWLVNFKINKLPKIHIVDRYLETAKCLGIKNDFEGLDYFISKEDIVQISTLPLAHQNGYIALVIGSLHYTKQLQEDKLISLCRKICKPIILLGGKGDYEKGEMIRTAIGENIFNACGIFNINQSASLIKMSEKVITSDTGLMHIAAAFRKEIISVWGNTVPAFGMYPYLPKGEEFKSKIFEITGLSCRPCSKLGFGKCPKGHFKCMNLMDENAIAELAN